MNRFNKLCAIIFGDCWQRSAARALKINERTVRHYKAGTRTPPDDVMKELRLIAKSKAAQLATASQENDE